MHSISSASVSRSVICLPISRSMTLLLHCTVMYAVRTRVGRDGGKRACAIGRKQHLGTGPLCDPSREKGEAAQSTGAATSALQLLCVSEIVERVLVILQSSGQRARWRQMCVVNGLRHLNYDVLNTVSIGRNRSASTRARPSTIDSPPRTMYSEEALLLQLNVLRDPELIPTKQPVRD